MALYQLTLFYPSVREHATTLRNIRTGVESVAGKNWRVVSAGEHTCAIVFETTIPPDAIQPRLGNFAGIERFEFLLVEIATIQGGYLSTDVWSWIGPKMAKPRQK